MKPLDPRIRQLIDDTNAADRPAPGVEAKIWETLSQRFAEPLPPTAAAASKLMTAASGSGGGVLLSVGAKWLISALLGGALCTSATVWYASRPTLRQTPPAQLATTPSVANPAAVTRPMAAVAEPALAPSPAPAPSHLLEETRLIADAQRALNGGASAKALAILEQHRSRFPSGELAQERDAARVFALCALGRNADAQRARRAFGTSWPDSPLGVRVRGGCVSARKARLDSQP
jgi:hypothetical protein